MKSSDKRRTSLSVLPVTCAAGQVASLTILGTEAFFGRESAKGWKLKKLRKKFQTRGVVIGSNANGFFGAEAYAKRFLMKEVRRLG